jgi:hypothetical protein
LCPRNVCRKFIFALTNCNEADVDMQVFLLRYN